MVFTPYKDESAIIEHIRKYQNEEYALLRMTATMIEKNNLDANSILRDLLKKCEMVDYSLLEHGGKYGVSLNALYIGKNSVESIGMKFYRVSNQRGDQRFSIETLKRRMQEEQIKVGDLLYISIFKESDGNSRNFIVNLTDSPSEEIIANAVGMDEITQLFHEIKPKLQKIVQGGFFDNSKGAGKIAPKDVGDTLESLLDIQTNNRNDADYGGLIEIKAKGKARTLDTLFTMRPLFEGTKTAEVESSDRNRVSAFTRLYGYDSDKHAGFSSLYITIGSKDYPQNNQGFFLLIEDTTRQVKLMHHNEESDKEEMVAFWHFDDLKQQLYAKHPSTLWVKAEQREVNGIVQFAYRSIEFSRTPQFATYLSLIKDGVVTYDWRGYTTKEGKYGGKNHGNAWRIKPSAKNRLFGELDVVAFE